VDSLLACGENRNHFKGRKVGAFLLNRNVPVGHAPASDDGCCDTCDSFMQCWILLILARCKLPDRGWLDAAQFHT